MSQMLDEYLDIIPKKSENLNINKEKFLFFFEPKIVGEEKVFSLFSLETGLIIFSVIIILQAISCFLGIFLPGSFFNFFYYALFFVLYGTTAVYLCLGYIKKKFLYTKVSYMIISCVFFIMAFVYILKSVFKILKFVIPFSGSFLSFDIVEYVIGRGAFLFGYLYLIYILYLFMIKLDNPKKNEEDNNLESPVINDTNNNY